MQFRGNILFLMGWMEETVTFSWMNLFRRLSVKAIIWCPCHSLVAFRGISLFGEISWMNFFRRHNEEAQYMLAMCFTWGFDRNSSIVCSQKKGAWCTHSALHISQFLWSKWDNTPN